MSPAPYLKQLATRCSHIAGEIADDDGFVSVRGLTERFGASLLVRPLLVEGMLASTEQASDGLDGKSRHRWCLLLDRETHDVGSREIAEERFGFPLSSRMRNTVAHELAHSLAFRPTEFGVEFPRQFSSQKTKQEFVEAIERETEKLSPLLLMPDALLDRIFSTEKDALSIQELCAVMRNAGVSRYVFVNRVNLLKLVDPKRIHSRDCLSNIAIGIGEWSSDREAILKAWPLFTNFEGGKVPGFLFQLQRRIPVAAKSLFTDPAFGLCAGDSDTTELKVPAGTPRNPTTVTLPIRFTVETVPRKFGSEFLYVVQSLRG
jgi:hypothetical protein